MELLPILLPLVALIPTAWLAFWTLGPLRLTILLRRGRPQFTIADFLCLFLLVQLVMGAVYGYLRFCWPERLREPGADVAVVFGVACLGLAFGLLWWFSVRSLSEAGLHTPWKRVLLIVVLIPLVIMDCAAVLIVSVRLAWAVAEADACGELGFAAAFAAVGVVLVLGLVAMRWLLQRMIALPWPPVEFLVAHRGASGDAPENTLGAIELAWRQGADAVEVDLRLTQDGRIVVIHDDTTQRTAVVDWKVAERTLAELRSLDVGRWKGEDWAGHRMPTLEEVLAAVPNGKRLFVEIKCGAEIVAELKRVLDTDARAPEDTAVLCFDLDVCAAAKRAMPRRPVLWLREALPKRDAQTGEIVAGWDLCRDQCLGAGLDGLSVASDILLGEDTVRQARAGGLLLYVWTVNSADEARRLARMGVDAIITDRPGRLREQLRAG